MTLPSAAATPLISHETADGVLDVHEVEDELVEPALEVDHFPGSGERAGMYGEFTDQLGVRRRVRVRRRAPARDGRVHLGVDRRRPGRRVGSGRCPRGGCLTVCGCRALAPWAPGVMRGVVESSGCSMDVNVNDIVEG
ncbi:hypothetical protein ACLMNJ_26445 [Streptomyces seoulensis]